MPGMKTDKSSPSKLKTDIGCTSIIPSVREGTPDEVYWSLEMVCILEVRLCEEEIYGD